MSNFSRMPSAISAAMPWPFGGISWQRVAAVVARDRHDPFGLVGREIFPGQRTAVGIGELDQRIRNLAVVVRLALGACDRLQGPRRSRESEQLADFRRPSPRQEGLRETGLRLQQRRRGGPFLLHHRRHQVATLGDLDGRRQQVGERQLAEAIAHRHPAAHGAGHGDRIHAAHRRRRGIGTVLRAEVLGVQAFGAGPEALRPCSCWPSHRMAKASLPRPLLTGSTSVMTAAVATAASTALPPFCRMRRPACAASGCEVDTTLRAKTGMRVEG